jgi:hypothetical protein
VVENPPSTGIALCSPKGPRYAATAFITELIGIHLPLLPVRDIREFMAKPAPMRHLYEIHTSPQPPLIADVLSGEIVAELARLREFL